MQIFRFSTIGDNLGTRMLGEKTRKILLPIIQDNDLVILDFEGVDIISNSFADECLAKLLLTIPLAELKKRTTFRGLNDMARKSISIAFQRRIQSMEAIKAD